MITKFIDEVILGLFGVIVILFNVINAGPLEVTVVGGLMIAAAVFEVLVEVFDKPTTTKKTTKK